MERDQLPADININVANYVLFNETEEETKKTWSKSSLTVPQSYQQFEWHLNKKLSSNQQNIVVVVDIVLAISISLLLFLNHEVILPSASLSYMCLGFQESKISIQCTWSGVITGNANKRRTCPNRVIRLPPEAHPRERTIRLTSARGRLLWSP